MGEIVNLNKARKARAKAEAEKKATDNRAKFGMTKAEKHTIADAKARLERHLEGHKRDQDDSDS